jgi:ATP-dependent Clp protease protease subunit
MWQSPAKQWKWMKSKPMLQAELTLSPGFQPGMALTAFGPLLAMHNPEFLQHRILFLSEEVNRESANRIISGLLLLDAADKEAPIDFYINSPGGSIIDGLAIIDTMRCIHAPVGTICLGQAASMAAWILAFGAKGRRMATPHAEIMIHQASGGFHGQTAVMRVYAERMARLQDELVAMLAIRTGQAPSRILRDIEVEHYMSATEAKRYGIVDKIIPHQPEPGAATKRPAAKRKPKP